MYHYTKIIPQRIIPSYCFINISRNLSHFTVGRETSWTRTSFNNKQSTIYLTNKRNFSWNQTVIDFWQTMSNSTPVAYIQQGLIEIHDITGIPWWSSIVLSTIIFRSVITLPLTIYQNKITARIENLTLEMPAIVAELKKETAMAVRQYKWSEKQARIIYNRSLKKQWNKLIVRDNCHPMKTLIVLWGQIPLWICQSVAIRNLIHLLPDPNSLQAQIILTQLIVGGFLWIPNLTEIDHSFILPISLGVLNLSIIEMQSMLRTRPPTRLQKLATNTFRILSIGMIPIAANVPAALCVYWVTSSAYGLFQNLLLLSPKVRRIVGIPKVQSEHEKPYQYLLNGIKKKTQNKSTNTESPS